MGVAMGMVKVLFMVKRKQVIKMRGVKPNFSWLRPKQSVPKDFMNLDLAMVTEGATDVFAKSAGARAYFRMILPPKLPWWKRVFICLEHLKG